MPSVIDQAVPSEVQSAMGSLFRLSPLASGSDVWFQVALPSVELKLGLVKSSRCHSTPR
jgi:hypothetical protein